ncbi:MAG: sulfite exporter TauE/SafE family protein [Propionibacteriaceae bacterium]|jgi:sulfite exporter TauE/SafE/copper chaperone CopZ|nr:sulfite exporter TauE/SafE family protein [Propionibacteriaceae bacterium]
MGEAQVNSVLDVRGMTCRACEQRVAKALRQVPGVRSAQVSQSKGKAFIVSDGKLDAAAVKMAVEKAGYTLGLHERPWLAKNRKVWADAAIGVAAVLLIALAWNLLGLDRAGAAVGEAATGGNLVFVLLLGVAASLSTCMALVGGIVMSLSASYGKRHPDAAGRRLLRPQLMFNAGRVIGFALLGAGIGAIGGVFSLSGRWLAIAMLAAALVMGWLGLRLTGVSPRLSAYSLTLPPSLTARLGPGGGYRDVNALLLGTASFFLPCGFTQAVQVYALSTGSWLQAGLVMGLFAIGTTPGLLGVGVLPALAKGARAERIFHFTGVAVLAFAVVNAMGAVNVLRPAGFEPPAAVSAPAGRSANVSDEGGAQVVRTVVSGYGYEPGAAVVYAGEPVKWLLDVQALGCASVVDGSSLGLGTASLAAGENTLEFTLGEPGTYRYSCAMGMYQGTFTAIEKA